MTGAGAGKFADKLGLRGIEPAQKLVQRAEHLLGKRRRDGGLRLALSSRAPAAVGRWHRQTGETNRAEA